MIANTMTTARHLWWISTGAWPGLLAGLAMTVFAAALLLPLVHLGASTTEYVVADRNTGLAISGFDPVAYFTERAALPGKSSFERAFAGAVWRFRNEGNRAAFAADPDNYMPRFGGYDPVGVARGVGVPGDPRLWLIRSERLYLFYTPEARADFDARTDEIIAAAENTWPEVQRTLSP